MRIGMVCPNYPPARFEGGVSHYTKCLSEAIAEMGHEVTAIGSTEFSSADKRYTAGVGVRRVSVEGPWGSSAVRRIREIARERKFDAIVLQYGPATYSTAFRLKWAVTSFACRKVTAFHALWGRRLDRIIGLMMLFSSERIVATNSEIMSIIERRLKFLLGKTYWVPIGSSIFPRVENNDRKKKVPVISCFGMLYPGKGVGLILDTIEELKRRKVAFIFSFIGGEIIYHRDFKKRLLRDVEYRGLKNIIEFTGFISEQEVSDRLRESQFLFMPYTRGLSDRRSTFMAAITHGKPVLTSAPILPLPFLKNGINVLWPESDTPAAYADCAQQLLDNDEWSAEMGRAAKILSESFSWDRIVAEYELVLEEGRPCR